MKRRVILGVAFVVVFFVGVAIGTSGAETDEASDSERATVTETTTETVTETETVEAGAVTQTVTVEVEPTASATIPGSGVFLVGDDVQPGTYRMSGSEGCYWARLSGTSGELDDVIANDNVDGPTVVTIVPSDVAFETNRCAEWRRQ